MSRKTHSATREQAARAFVRAVLTSSFKQNADDETVNAVARNVLKGFPTFPNDQVVGAD